MLNNLENSTFRLSVRFGFCSSSLVNPLSVPSEVKISVKAATRNSHGNIRRGWREREQIFPVGVTYLVPLLPFFLLFQLSILRSSVFDLSFFPFSLPPAVSSFPCLSARLFPVLTFDYITLYAAASLSNIDLYHFPLWLPFFFPVIFSSSFCC